MTSNHYFVALPIPKEITDLLTTWKQSNERALTFKKWVHPADYHITLFFIGAAEQKQLSAFMREARYLAQQTPPFQLSLKQAGYFGQSASPRVFYIGVERGDRLQHLQEKIARVGESLRFNRERRPYRPHITMARKWAGEEQFQNVALSPITEATWNVESFALYKTHVGKTPKYEKVEVFSLQ